MIKPKISIIIPTYGRAEYLKELIKSVRSSTPPGEYEFVVVSSDFSETDKIKWLSEQTDVNLVFEGVRQDWQVRKNGLAHYMNVGVENAKGEWVFVVNDDMFFAPDWYREFSNFLADPNNSDVAVIVVSTHISRVSYGQRIAVIGQTKKGNNDWKDLYLSDFSIIRRDVLNEIGLYDEKINWHGYSTDCSLAIEFLTDKKIVASDKIKLDHFIVEAERNLETIDEFTDFNYVKRKWDKWCRANNCQYKCDFGGVKPYTLKNRLINYLKRRRKILQRYKKYLFRKIFNV